MTEAEIIARANQAKRILDDPLVIEAIAAIERDVIEAFHDCPVRDTEGMRILQSDLRRARKLKGILQGVMERGKMAAHDLREKETLAQMAVRRIRS